MSKNEMRVEEMAKIAEEISQQTITNTDIIRDNGWNTV
jgi:hypothetical protein